MLNSRARGRLRGVSAAQTVSRLKRRRVLFAVALISLLTFIGATPVFPAHAAVLSAPRLEGPIARTATTLSVRFYRSAESSGVCQEDIGYEFRGGGYADWYDAGTFPDAPCDDPDPGFKFTGLTPATHYEFSVRAYRIVGGTKTDFSPASTLAASTSVATSTPAPAPTPPDSPTAVPTTAAPPATIQPGIILAAVSGALALLLLIAWRATRAARASRSERP